MRRELWLVAVAGLAFLALAVAACGSDSSERAILAAPVVNGGQPQGISVSGQGRASGVPDVALLTMGVSARAPTVAGANAQAQEAMNKLLQSLRANGVAEKDIQTQQFSITPEFGRIRTPEDEPRITGYRVTNILRVKVRRVADAGKVIDAAVSAAGDVLQVQGISLTIDDPKPLREQARAEAMAEAKAKAEQLARLAGVGLGKPIVISEGGGLIPPPIPFERAIAAPARGGDTPISPGELEVTVSVQVVYAIQ